MIDRINPPQVHPIGVLPDLNITPEVVKGVDIFSVEGGTSEVVKIDVVFKAGSRLESKPMLSAVCQAMLKEGTASFSAEQISATFDYYGAQFGTDLKKDRAEVSLLCQTRHLDILLPIFAEILTCPAFDAHELTLLKKRGKSVLAVNLEKVQFKSRLLFNQLLFDGTPYLDKIAPEYYDDIERQDLLSYFHSNYHLSEAHIVVSGWDCDTAIAKLSNLLPDSEGENSHSDEHIAWDPIPLKRFQEKPGAIQSGIRVGRKVVGRSHKDYIPLYLANIALGGYFGSRLMQNIREEKGYTYGIGSSLNHLEYGSYLSISTEVGSEVTGAAMVEINRELERMCHEKMDLDELQRVRNYVAGSLIQGFDGPFARAQRLKVLLANDLPSTFFRRLSQELYGVDPDEIVRISNKYFHPELMTEAVVGQWDGRNE